MNTNTFQKNPVHIGRNVRRLREIKNIKQESLAMSLSISQQKISKLEQSENIDEETLKKIAAALEISVEAITNFDEEAVINNCYHTNTLTNPNFNPMDKIIELYERLIASERDKNALLAKSSNIRIFREEQDYSGYQNTGTSDERDS